MPPDIFTFQFVFVLCTAGRRKAVVRRLDSKYSSHFVVTHSTKWLRIF